MGVSVRELNCGIATTGRSLQGVRGTHVGRERLSSTLPYKSQVKGTSLAITKVSPERISGFEHTDAGRTTTRLYRPRWLGLGRTEGGRQQLPSCDHRNFLPSYVREEGKEER